MFHCVRSTNYEVACNVIIPSALGTTLLQAFLLLSVFVLPSDRWQQLRYVTLRCAVPSEVLLRLEYCVTRLTIASEKLPPSTALLSVKIVGLSVMVVTVRCGDGLSAAGLATFMIGVLQPGSG